MSASPVNSRGVLYPADLPSLHREPVTGDLAVFVRWFWVPEWNLRPGHTSRQLVIGFPACNLVVERNTMELAGPTTRASCRELSGNGWAVGALLRPAAVPSLLNNVRSVRDTSVSVDYPSLSSFVRAAMDADAPATERRDAATTAFAGWLLHHLGTPSDEALLANRMVEAAETDSTLVTVTDLASHLHISTRSLQRLAAKYVGLSPAALIRRRRLQEAAERFRSEPHVNLTALAQEFGYADHAHLTNDFRTTLGFAPSAYRRTLLSE